MKFGLDDSIIEKLQAVLETCPKIDKAYIFGSRAKGNYRADSDIDIAVKGYNITLDDIIKLGVAFEENSITHTIDLLDYNNIKEPALAEHIDRVGIEFYSRWKEYRFSELLIDESISYGIVQPGFHTEINSVPIIKVNNIKNGKINTDEITRVSCEIEEKYQRTRLQGGELLITVVGSVGECAIVPPYLKGWNVARAVSVARIKEQFDKRYIKYCFQSDDIKFQMYGSTNDTVQPTLNLSSLKNLIFRLPPLAEQTAIASILSSLDDKIDLLHRQNKTLEELAETLFRQWFIEEAEESWEEKSLTEIADYLNGLALQKFPPKGNEYLPVIKIREMKQGVSENTDKCSNAIPAQYIIRNGDVLFSWSGSLDIALWAGEDGGLNQHLFKVTSKNYPKWFYFLATKHHLPDFRTIAESKSTTMGHIQREHIDNAMISVPPKHLLEQLDFIIAPLLDKQIYNNHQIRTLTQLRDTLLPKLVSGEVRVKM